MRGVGAVGEPRGVLGPAVSVCIPITCPASLPIHPDAKNLSFFLNISLFFFRKIPASQLYQEHKPLRGQGALSMLLDSKLNFCTSNGMTF